MADEKSLEAEADLLGAVAAMTGAKGAYHSAQDEKFSLVQPEAPIEVGDAIG